MYHGVVVESDLISVHFRSFPFAQGTSSLGLILQDRGFALQHQVLRAEHGPKTSVPTASHLEATVVVLSSPPRCLSLSPELMRIADWN